MPVETIKKKAILDKIMWVIGLDSILFHHYLDLYMVYMLLLGPQKGHTFFQRNHVFISKR